MLVLMAAEGGILHAEGQISLVAAVAAPGLMVLARDRVGRPERRHARRACGRWLYRPGRPVGGHGERP
ncbi:MAG: hypothetical protein ACLP50_26940 [Solirubrobacteraceae bacterium]